MSRSSRSGYLSGRGQGELRERSSRRYHETPTHVYPGLLLVAVGDVCSLLPFRVVNTATTAKTDRFQK